MTEPMGLAQLKKKYEDMSEEELEEHLNELRSIQRIKATGKVKSRRKSPKSKLKSLLSKMSPEERKEFLKDLKG